MTRFHERTEPLESPNGRQAVLALAFACAAWGCAARPAGWETGDDDPSDVAEAEADAEEGEGEEGEATAQPTTLAKVEEPATLSVSEVDWSERPPACSPSPPDDEASVHCVSRAQDLLAQGTGADAFGFGVVMEAIAVATDVCDQDGLAESQWVTARGPHVTVFGLDQSAAHGDSGQLALRFEALYDTLRGAFEVAWEPKVDLYFSPNPVAAATHDRHLLAAFPADRRTEGLYGGSDDEFVAIHPGWFLSQVFVAQAAVDGEVVLPLFANGLAEVFDDSGRDLHLAYAAQLVSGKTEDGAAVAEFTDDDIDGLDRSAAGSLARYLVNTYGMPAVMNMVRASAVRSDESGLVSATFGEVDSAAALEDLVAGVVEAETGDDWEDVRSGWRGAVLDVLNEALPSQSEQDQIEIENLVRLADQAINLNDASLYRSTMEGFYCQTQGDKGRLAAAREIVSSLGTVGTRIVEILPSPTKSFRSVRVVAVRTTDEGKLTAVYYDLERFPVGWRFTGGSDS